MNDETFKLEMRRRGVAVAQITEKLHPDLQSLFLGMLGAYLSAHVSAEVFDAEVDNALGMLQAETERWIAECLEDVKGKVTVQ